MPARRTNATRHDDLMASLVHDGALAPVGHSLERERFVEQQHGGFS
jgi:hypothetical protein